MMSVNTCSNKTAKASTPWFYKAQDVFSALRDESFAKPEAGPWSGSTRGYLTQIESEMNEADEKLLLSTGLCASLTYTLRLEALSDKISHHGVGFLPHYRLLYGSGKPIRLS